MANDVDLAFVAGDSFGDAGGEFAKLGHFAGEAVEALVNGIEAFVNGIEALVNGVEAFIDVLVEIVEALADGVEALVDGVEALVHGVDKGEFHEPAEKAEDDAQDADGGGIVPEPVPHGAVSLRCGLEGV